ncbi:UDP-N-acetylglucosamine--N-acetylmuramyl-(pentapeptide) pyrophosphoryl-undecaprenol N-acetylglucosamine transferase [subsurface metagenome]
MPKKKKKLKILFTGGGTAGHVFPIIAVCREIRKLGLDPEFFYLGPKDQFASILLSQEGIKVKTILAGKIRRYLTWQSILQNMVDVLFKMPLGLFQSFFFMFFLAPDLIFSKGGYGSVASCLSGWLLQTPIFLHESDVTPGLANRFLARFSSQIFVSFPISQTEYFSAEKMVSVGNPIRQELLSGSKTEAKKLFGLSSQKPIILILGGSQGAQKINDTILAILPGILADFELIHQTGDKNVKQVKAEAKVVISKELGKYYHALGFLNEIELREALAVADLVVSRAGSGSIFEMAASYKPSILIPLSISAQNHQVKNAYAYAERGAALVIEEANLSPHFFLEKVKYLFSHAEELKKMSKGAEQFSKPDSAKTLAEYILNYLVR